MSSILASACTIRPSLAGPTCRGRLAQTPAFQSSVPRRTLLVRAEDPKKGETNDKAKDPVNKGGKAYIDELPPTPQSTVSPEMKKKMRDEYLSLGGSPNKPLANNWFLWIILGVTFLVALTYITGSV